MFIIADVVAHAIKAPETSAAVGDISRGLDRSASPSASGLVLVVPLSPLLIFGYGPIPGFGIACGGMAVVLMTLPMLVPLAS